MKRVRVINEECAAGRKKKEIFIPQTLRAAVKDQLYPNWD